MRIISRKKLREFWEQHPDARASLESWFVDVKQADWETTNDIKTIYRNASFIANNRVVFNIKGNKYRLVIAIQYTLRIVYIRFVGTHQEYDVIDVKNI
jgi:mRNA interferase HigB